MPTVYGYCRISRKKQNMDRQERNILTAYPKAYIVREVYTGTKMEGRRELNKLLKMLVPGDTVVYDSASRMSRNAEEGCDLYEELFHKGIDLIFLQEPQINTEVYRNALDNQIRIYIDTGNRATDEFIKGIIDALNKYTVAIAKEQIRIVFAQAQKEADDLHQRTREGMITAALNGKQIGRRPGSKYETKKAVAAKEIIRKYNKAFGGQLTDVDTMKLANCSKKTYYKYKKELLESM